MSAMTDNKIDVSATMEGVVAAKTLTPTIASDGKWTSGFKGVLMDCPLDIAWDFFSDWANWGRWQTSSLICELREGENRKPGSLRFLKYPAWWLNERILEIDNEKHFLSYSIEENDFFGGMKGFVGCIQFQESGDGKTMVEYWKYELEPVENQTPESLCGFLNDTLKGILAELERGAKTHAPGPDPKPRLNQTSENQYRRWHTTSSASYNSAHTALKKSAQSFLQSPSHHKPYSGSLTDSPLLQQCTRGDGLLSVTSPGRDNHGEELVLLQKAPCQRTSLLQEVVRQCWIAVPMICVNLLQYAITVLSVMFVGHLGKLELASASIANSMAGVLGYYVLLGMGSALETLCGQAYGAAQYHMLGVYLQRALLVLFLTCLPLSFVFLHMADILVFVGQDPEIANKAGEYSLYLLPSLFGYALLQPVVKFLQTQSVVIPMLVCSATTFVLHAGILYTFIYTLGLGFRGAAMATSLSFWINAILLILYVKFSGVCKETWNRFTREAFVDLYEFLELAVPSCVMICLEYWCFEILVMASGLLPNPQLELSGLSVCLSTITLNYMIPFGLSAAASTRVSNELGAGNARAAKYAVYVAMSMSAFQATIVGSILVALRFQWGWFYSNEAEVVHYVGTIMPFLACIALFDGIQGVLSGVARGCGRQELGAWINFCTFYIIGVPTALLLAFHFNMGGRGLFTGLLCGLGTQMLTLSIFTLQTDWDNQVQIATARVLHDEHEGLKGFEKVLNDTSNTRVVAKMKLH